jgi:TolB-like protein
MLEDHVEKSWRYLGDPRIVFYSPTMIYRFGPFELDLEKAELRADGEIRSIEPQVFALLALLVANGERVVSKDEIIEKVWDGRPVSESAVSSRIKSVRQVLGDDGKSQRYVRTIHRRGFRFVAEARSVSGDSPLLAAVEPATENVRASDGLPPLEDLERPSIAVLPFRLIGEAGSHAAIADAVPHELIAELARLRWLFVTARGSSFRLRSPEIDAPEVGRLLGVHYCLSGAVEVAGERLAVNVELADTRSAGVVWADSLRGSIDDVHAFREQIRARVITALDLEIPLHEAALARLKGTEQLDAWSAYHLGLQHVYRFNRQDNAQAAALFTRAIALDPGFARAHAGLSFVHFQTAFMRHSEDLAGEIELARRHADRGLQLEPMDPFVNFTMGRSFWLEGKLTESLGWLERATSISPNFAQGIYARAWTEALEGHGLESRRHADLAMRLSPLDPLYYAMLGTRAFAHMASAEYEPAAEWAERAARAPGAHVLIALIAATAHAIVGNKSHAESWAANVRSRNATLTRQDFFRSFPMKQQEMRLRVSKALQQLGF